MLLTVFLQQETLGQSNNFHDSRDKVSISITIDPPRCAPGSDAVVAIALNQLGLKAKSFSAAQVGLKTTAQFSRAKILDLNKEIIINTISAGYIPVITGFQGITDSGDTTTETLIFIYAQLGHIVKK